MTSCGRPWRRRSGPAPEGRARVVDKEATHVRLIEGRSVKEDSSAADEWAAGWRGQRGADRPGSMGTITAEIVRMLAVTGDAPDSIGECILSWAASSVT